jgi:hypothetical protein
MRKRGVIMIVRLFGIAALVALVVAAAPATAQSKPNPPPLPAPSKTSVSGVLKGVDYTHDGKAEWAALVVCESATYSINGGGDSYKNMKKLAGKRVVVKGSVATEVRGPDGKMMKLSGTAGSIRYDGVVSIANASDVTLQPVTEISGTVEEGASPSGTDSRKVSKVLRLVVAGEHPTTYVAGTAASNKLKAHTGKRVVARCYLSGETIEDVESVAPAKG